VSDTAVIPGPSSVFRPFELRMYTGHLQPILATPVCGLESRSAGDRINMIFGRTSRQYSFILLSLFILSGLITVVSLIGLLLAPLYGNQRVGIALYSALAAGLAILALVIRRAQIIDSPKK